MRKLEVKIRQIIWAFKRCFKPTTYDYVRYDGKVYWIKSSLSGEDVWDLYEPGKSTSIRHIKGDDLIVIHTFDRFVRVFNQHLRFRETSWGRIDEQNPIGTRLSFNNSEDIYFANR